MDFKIVSCLSLFLTVNLLDVFGLPTKPLDREIVYARHGQSRTLPCSAFEEALQLEGDDVCYVRWSNRTYDGVETQWVPFAVMNGDGGIYVDGDGHFNISKDDGGLYIHEAQPSDNQIYMCTVVLCSGRSPLKSYVTLEFSDDKDIPATEKPTPSEAATTRGSKKREKVLVEITYPYRGAFIVAITIAAISIFGNVVLAFLLCRVRSHRSTK